MEHGAASMRRSFGHSTPIAGRARVTRFAMCCESAQRGVECLTVLSLALAVNRKVNKGLAF